MRPSSLSRPRRMLKLAAKTAVLGLLTAGVVTAGPTSPTSAAGTSNTVLNCYTQWWSTAWAQRCYSGGADVAGRYRSRIFCGVPSGIPLQITVPRSQGSTSDEKGPDCVSFAFNGSIVYLG